MRLDGIIFDFDGTIADSGITAETLCLWRDELSLDCEYYQLLEAIEQLPEKHRKEKQLQIEKLETTALMSAKLMEGFIEWYQYIFSQNIKAAVFSRNLRSSIESFLLQHKVTFDLVIGREDAAKKPDPEGIFIILKKLDLDASRTLLIGDDPVLDISCGKDTGVKTALLTHNKNKIGGSASPHFIWANLIYGLEEIKALTTLNQDLSKRLPPK